MTKIFNHPAKWLILLTLLLLAFIAFKWPDLLLPHYWDESWSYAISVQKMYEAGPTLLPGKIDPVYTRGHPLFFYFLASGWMKIFGPSLLAKHVFALLISLLHLLLVYKIVKSFSDDATALVTLLVLCCSGIFFVQSSMLLPEVLVSLLSMAGLYYWWLQKRVWAIFFIALLILTKESGLVILPVIFIYEIINWYQTKNTKSWLISMGYLALACLPLLVFFAYQKFIYGWWLYPEHVGYLETSYSIVLHKFKSFLIYLLVKKGSLILWTFLFALAWLGTRQKKKYQKALLLGILTIWFLGWIYGQNINPRNWFYAGIFLIIVGCFFMYALPQLQTQNRKWVILVLLFCLLYIVFCAYNFFSIRYLLPVYIWFIIILIMSYGEVLKERGMVKWSWIILLPLFVYYNIQNGDIKGDDSFNCRQEIKIKMNAFDYLVEHAQRTDKIDVMQFHTGIELKNAACGYLKQEELFNLAGENNGSPGQWFIVESTGEMPVTEYLNDHFQLAFSDSLKHNWVSIYKRKE